MSVLILKGDVELKRLSPQIVLADMVVAATEKVVGDVLDVSAHRRLIDQAPQRLRSGGVLIFELGFGQADAVTELISGQASLTMVDLRRDLRGIPRTAIARRRKPD